MILIIWNLLDKSLDSRNLIKSSSHIAVAGAACFANSWTSSYSMILFFQQDRAASLKMLIDVFQCDGVELLEARFENPILLFIEGSQ